MDTSLKNIDRSLFGLLGVCPLLAKSTTLLTGLTMGFCALLVLIFTTFSVSSCRRLIPYSLRLPTILIISVTWVTVFDLLMQAYWFEMRQVLGMYLPLLAMNSFVLISLEQTALTTPVAETCKIKLLEGSLILVIVTIIGLLRELLGAGSVLSDAEILLGSAYGQWSFTDGAYTILLKAPGALFGLAILLAGYREFENRRAV